MTFEKVQKILAEQLELDADEITMDSSLVEDLGIDSLDFVDIVMSLEDEFDTEFPEEDMAGIKTVGDIVKYIEDKIQKPLPTQRGSRPLDGSLFFMSVGVGLCNLPRELPMD